MPNRSPRVPVPGNRSPRITFASRARRRCGLWIAWTTACALTLLACSGSTPGQGECPECAADAGLDSSTLVQPSSTPDGAVPAATAPLKLAITRSGVARTCGDCAVITAHAEGGTPPYVYAWSNPNLIGPGPYEVCDTTGTSYSLTVTDSSEGSVDVGSSASAMHATASVDLPCEAPTADAGAGFSGCKVLLNASIFTLIDPSTERTDAVYACATLDGKPGVRVRDLDPDAGPETSMAGQYLQLSDTLQAGQPYTFNLDLVLSVQFGGDLRLEVWGSNAGCAAEEMLGEVGFKEGGSGATLCFTPTRAFDKLLLRPSAKSMDPTFALSLGVSMTVCSRCDAP